MSDALDGKLPWWRKPFYALHLSRCTRCQAVHASLTRTVDALKALRDEPVDPPP
jgi:anti-sigma factor RsiW